MQDPQISNFYLANLNTHPIFSIFTSQQCLGNASKQKVEYNKKIRTCFYQGSLTKIPKFCLLIFTLGASGLNRKVAKKKSHQCQIFVGVPFMRNFEVPKLSPAPLQALPSSPVSLGQNSKFRSQFFVLSSRR